MHPDATTVLDLKAFYFLEQAIPDVQRELLPAYLVAAEGVSPNIKVLEWWDKQEELPHWAAASCCASHHPQQLKVFLGVMTRAHHSKIIIDVTAE